MGEAALKYAEPLDMQVGFDESAFMENMQTLVAVYITCCLTAVILTELRSPHHIWSILCDRKTIKYIQSMLASLGLAEGMGTH